jgi:flagellar biosynthesis/type III secretory pathway M-ring protein FliF/YscJ
MFQQFVLSDFLYFPQDKSEYIPATISLAFFMILAFITMRIIIKVSNREAEKAKEFEEQLKKNQTMQKDSH